MMKSLKYVTLLKKFQNSSVSEDFPPATITLQLSTSRAKGQHRFTMRKTLLCTKSPTLPRRLFQIHSLDCKTVTDTQLMEILTRDSRLSTVIGNLQWGVSALLRLQSLTLPLSLLHLFPFSAELSRWQIQRE